MFHGVRKIKKTIRIMSNRFFKFIAGLFCFYILACSLVIGQAFLDSKARQDRFRLKTSSLSKPRSICFLAYGESLLADWQCEGHEASHKYRLRIETGIISQHQDRSRLLGTGPAEFPITRSSYDFGLRGAARPSGESLYSEVELDASFNRHLALRASVLGVHALSEEQAFARLQSFWVETGFNSLVIGMGRQPLYWGQSMIGPLLIGDSARNLDMLRISTQAFQLSGFLRYLGHLKAEAFLTRLESERVPPHDWLFGWRFGLKPSPRLEVNFAYLYQFGGGIRKASWKEYLVELAGARLQRYTNDPIGSDATNRSGAMDLRWQFSTGDIPSAFYTEQHLEDCCGTLKVILEKSYNYIYGLEIYPRTLWGKPLFQVEYAKTTFALYRHHAWRSGTSRFGQLMGHPLGRDSQGLYLYARTTANFKWSLGLSVLAEEILRSGQVTDDRWLPASQREVSEFRFGISPSLTWFFHRNYSAEAQLAIVGVENKAYMDSARDLEYMLGLRIQAELF